MIFEKIIINDKEELQKYKKSIFNLFEDSFGEKLDEDLWNWAYLENPNGSPIVSLYFDDKKLAGHYAVIPVSLIFNGLEIKAILSMTTMVDVSYRRYGIFITQAEEVYQKAIELGYKFVYGFPNKKSAPGFKKRLQWILEENLYVAKLNKKELLDLKKQNDNCISFNIINKENMNWRLNKPNQEYIQKQNSFLKKFGNEFDIIFNSYNFNNLNENFEYNILLDTNLEDYLGKKQFDYIFGYRLFDESFKNICFKKDLIMSDIF